MPLSTPPLLPAALPALRALVSLQTLSAPREPFALLTRLALRTPQAAPLALFAAAPPVAVSYALLVSVHVLANLVWIGSILSVALLVASARLMATPAEVGALARRIYLRLAAPAFVVSFLAGLGRFAGSASVYAHLPWMHAKLTFGLIAIVLHHIVGARAKRLAAGREEGARGAVALGVAIFLCAAASVFCVIVRP